ERSDTLVAEPQRCFPVRGVDRRQLPLAFLVVRSKRKGGPHWTVRALSIAGHGRTGVHELPVGRFAAGSGLPSNLSRFRSRYCEAVPLVAVQADFSVRRRQTAEPRSYLSPPHGLTRPLPDAAVTYAPGLVLLSPAGLVSTDVGDICVFRGAGSPVVRAGAAQASIVGRRRHYASAIADISDWQLRVLQPANDLALPVLAR